MYPKIKLFLSLFVMGVGIVSLFTSLGGGLLILVSGFLLMPKVSNNLKTKVTLWQKRIIRIASTVFVFFIGAALVGKQSNETKANTKSEYVENGKPESKFKKYVDAMDERIANLPEARKESRAKLEDGLKATETYKTLVDSAFVGSEYLPVLTLLSEGIKGIYIDSKGQEGFGVKERLVKVVDNQNNGNDKLNFGTKVIALATEANAGIPLEILEVVERYRKKFGMYGESGRFYDKNKKEEVVETPYHLTFIYALVKPSKGTLDAIYVTNSSVISEWDKPRKKGAFAYPYMAVKKDYIEHIKQVYPNSQYILKVDVEITANELYKAYQDNEISADNKYKGKKLAVTGTIDDIGNDIMDDSYVTLKTGDLIGSVQCYLDKNVVGKLRKGQKITVVGECSGLMMNVLIKDCELWIY